MKIDKMKQDWLFQYYEQMYGFEVASFLHRQIKNPKKDKELKCRKK
jgi:hypothetical protein